MSADRDLSRIVRSWLHEDAHEDADRVLDLVLDQLDATPQRRPLWWSARRFPTMSITTLRFGIAGAALVVAILAGIALLGRAPDVGPAGPTPTPAASIPLLSDQGTIEQSAALAPGTYLLDSPFPARLALTVPSGWMVWHVDFLTAGLLVDSGSGPGSGWGLFFLSPGDRLYADPCDKTRGMLEPIPGPTVDDLATALASLPGMTATTPVDIDMGGQPGKLIELTATADTASCPAGSATLWDFAGQDDIPMALGERIPIRIFDMDGVRLVIVATDDPGTSAWELQHGESYNPDAHADDQVELHAILDSIQFE